MKILLSAFSCGPGLGSEPGAGWNIALETARLGHEVVVLTPTAFQVEIQREAVAGKLPANLRFDFYMPTWLKRIQDAGSSLTWHFVSLLWQFCALFYARARYKHANFDLVHHVSYAGIRYPTLLTRLGLPTVIGPLGGGETAPMRLRKAFPWKAWFSELLRDFHTWTLRFDPITRFAFRDAKLIFLRTEESMVAVPQRYRDKVHIDLGLGIAEILLANHRMANRKPGESFQLLYAGRLLWWKGVHLAIRALSDARDLGVDAKLTIIGDGPARSDLQTLARRLGVSDHVVWRGKLSRAELLAVYPRHHAFLFPSLHEAGGTVILEAWAYGLPVICLSLGGPGRMVNSSCGRVISVANRGEDACAKMLASEIVALSENEDLWLALSRGAVARAREFSWSKVVAALHTEMGNRLQHEPAPALGQ
jgi:glycosyltransferase involved in cell wall biosynthesis